MEKENIIEVKDLHVDIKMMEGTLTPVRGVNFEIKKGETLGLVGESGCGKSITCKAILGINDKKCIPSGEIVFRNEDENEVDLLKMDPKGKEIRNVRGKQISMIFQEPMVAFSPMYTIGNQINEATLLHITKDKKKAKEISLEVMRKVGIANVEKRYNQYPHEFSGGMLQRALIAMALVCNPKLLIADEPTTALDVTIQAQILELMKELQKEFDMAILFITHDLGVVAKMCDRVAVMYLGRIVETGDATTIYANPQHPYTRGLMGSVHKIGGRKDERLFSIEGTVPLAMNLPKQCGFYDRCDARIEGLCDKAEPELVEIEKGHKIACFACQNAACQAHRKEVEERLKREESTKEPVEGGKKRGKR
ncbi:ABC transporter ATP-binding protein [Butyrivibrio sp. INlla14]|uniref:ABC transporter ATP-binding protein n=1 Tax=Butyrivibrio sp. INlla14 TaxID=1520808 RepID=UPI0008764F49|nr:ABC transporter ATP-binding protein [Butyrivibrio sp. INlla14]SCX98715.1 peptide/nickel transport system ATP-binding protein [Butyrivibrio sp. INlla14]